ncbi:MAG: prepilin-type N-terminal cleavage/methylation domain-containing protein [Phycisphaerae bacterium]|nr:prepilin-type N-terminal cleavage/methylation domain-containing protein [Phycisphaerae bacterium]
MASGAESRLAESVRRLTGRTRPAFSLVELVVVVVIIGLLASMAIPRLSRGSSDAGGAALDRDLTLVRYAIVHYSVEHGNKFPGPTADEFTEQLVQYSDATGDTNATRGGQYVLGPYLQAIPPLPKGANAGRTEVLIDTTNSPPKPAVAQPYGWVYNPSTGEFIGNVPSLGTAQLEEAEAEAVPLEIPQGG